MTYVVAILALVSAGQTWLLWRILCAVGTLDKVADESVRVSRTLHLLMETTESGFVSFGGVLGEALQPLRRRRAAARTRAAKNAQQDVLASSSDVIASAVNAERSRAWRGARAEREA